MSIDNNVVAMFNAMAGAYAEADANTGEGLQGEWPPEGESDHIVRGITAKADKGKNKDGSEYPIVSVQFNYEAMPTNDPTADPTKPPLQWKGEPFRLPPNPAQVTDAGTQTACRIQLERFKGHCSKLLKKSKDACTNPGEDIQAISAILGRGEQLVAQVKIQYRDGKVKPGSPPGTKPATYKSEFIMDLISG